MQRQDMNHTLTSHNHASHGDDYVTIVAPTLAEVMGEFRASGLSEQGYKIAGRADRHTFAIARNRQIESGGLKEMFEGARMVAATFVRTLDRVS